MYSYILILKPINWYWYNSLISSKFQQFCMQSFACVYLVQCNFITCIDSYGCNHSEGKQYPTLWSSFMLPFYGSSYHLSFLPNSWKNINLFSLSIFLLFSDCYINGIKKCATFWDWLFSQLLHASSDSFSRWVSSKLQV